MLLNFFGGNLDYPAINKLNKVCFDDWTCTKILKQAKLYSNNVYLFKNGRFLLFKLGGNLDILDFLQKKFYNMREIERQFAIHSSEDCAYISDKSMTRCNFFSKRQSVKNHF